MKFLNSPLAPLAAMFVGIFAFGGGLTSPIWLIVAGTPPLEAIHAGTPIVGVTIVGLILTVILGLIAYRLRKPDATPVSVANIAPAKRNETLVHIVVMLMFIVPFVTIIVGYLLHSLIDADARLH